MSFVLALDQGTTSSRAIVFDRDGNIRGSAQQEFRQIFPKPGWVEHDPLEIWSSQRAVVDGAIAKAAVKTSDIVAIGITNQRETTVLWDRATGLPVAPAIVWQDRRTAGICDQLRSAGHAALFQRKTGLVLDAYFSGTKLQWLLDHVDGARARAERGELAFGTVDSWLIWNLSDGSSHVTDPSNASRTLMFNIRTGDWDDELLAVLRIPRSLLPRVCGSSTVVAHASINGATIPIAGIAGDQQAALFGQACHTPGMAKNTYGTGCFMLMNTGADAIASRNNLLTTVAWRLGESNVHDANATARGEASSRTANTLQYGMQYALEGSVFIGGALVQWLRDGLGIIKSAPEIEALAQTVPDSGGVVLVPAFAGLGAPHWDPYARGSLFGLTRGTTTGHLARAALDAIALQSAEVLDAMQADSGITLSELRVDGGAAANNLLMQRQADLLGVPVVRPKVVETTALGAAYLAGLATGYWSSPAEIGANWQVDRRFEPALPASDRRALRARWDEGVSRAKGWEPADA